MVTIRACRMLNATASTVAMPRPYRASAELQSDKCIKLDGVRLETNMPLKADRNNPGDIQRTGRSITDVRQTARMQKGFYAAAK